MCKYSGGDENIRIGFEDINQSIFGSNDGFREVTKGISIYPVRKMKICANISQQSKQNSQDISLNRKCQPAAREKVKGSLK